MWHLNPPQIQAEKSMVQVLQLNAKNEKFISSKIMQSVSFEFICLNVFFVIMFSVWRELRRSEVWVSLSDKFSISNTMKLPQLEQMFFLLIIDMTYSFSSQNCVAEGMPTVLILYHEKAE